MMANRYRVHSVQRTSVFVTGTVIDGVTMADQTFPYAVIELVPVNELDRETLTWREPLSSKEDAEYVASTFIVGRIVEIGDFSLVPLTDSEAT